MHYVCLKKLYNLITSACVYDDMIIFIT